MKHPKCGRDPSECRIVEGTPAATLMSWAPVYDGNGKRVDRGDPNISTQARSCQTCRRRWVLSTQYGETTIRDEPNDLGVS